MLSEHDCIEERRGSGPFAVWPRPAFPLARILLVSAKMMAALCASPRSLAGSRKLRIAPALAVRDALGFRSSVTVSIGTIRRRRISCCARADRFPPEKVWLRIASQRATSHPAAATRSFARSIPPIATCVRPATYRGVNSRRAQSQAHPHPLAAAAAAASHDASPRTRRRRLHLLRLSPRRRLVQAERRPSSTELSQRDLPQALRRRAQRGVLVLHDRTPRTRSNDRRSVAVP